MYNRFKNQGVHEEYDFFSMGIPHYQKMHHETANIVMRYIQNSFCKGTEVKLLDIGVGSGLGLHHVTSMLNQNGINYSIDAIDNNSSMLQSLQQKINRREITGNITLIEKDIFDFLEETLNEYHIIYSGRVIHNFLQADKDKIHKKVYDALQRNGLFVNTDKIALDDALQQQKNVMRQIKQLDVFEEYGKGDLKDEWIRHYEQDEQDDRRMEETILLNQLKSLGFGNVCITCRNRLEAIVSCIKR